MIWIAYKNRIKTKLPRILAMIEIGKCSGDKHRGLQSYYPSWFDKLNVRQSKGSWPDSIQTDDN